MKTFLPIGAVLAAALAMPSADALAARSKPQQSRAASRPTAVTAPARPTWTSTWRHDQRAHQVRRSGSSTQAAGGRQGTTSVATRPSPDRFRFTEVAPRSLW